MPRNPMYGDATLEDVARSMFRDPPEKGQQAAENDSPTPEQPDA